MPIKFMTIIMEMAAIFQIEVQIEKQFVVEYVEI